MVDHYLYHMVNNIQPNQLTTSQSLPQQPIYNNNNNNNNMIHNNNANHNHNHNIYVNDNTTTVTHTMYNANNHSYYHGHPHPQSPTSYHTQQLPSHSYGSSNSVPNSNGHNPTYNPTKIPTLNPSEYPSSNPTQTPTHIPSENPTFNPSKQPTLNPSENPTSKPSITPTFNQSGGIYIGYKNTIIYYHYQDIHHVYTKNCIYIGTNCNSIVSVSNINIKSGDTDLQIIFGGHNLGIIGIAAISPKLDSLIATLSEDGLIRLWIYKR